MLKKISKNETRLRRHARVRTKVSGTPECPRLNVFRSNAHIHVQVIDANGGNKEAAQKVGAEIAKLCKAANINKVVFDRGGYVYHGRVQALADAAREAGLEF